MPPIRIRSRVTSNDRNDTNSKSRDGIRGVDCGRVRRGCLFIGAFAEQPERVRRFQTYGGWQRVDDRQSEHQRVAIVLLRRRRTELRSIRPAVYVGVGAAWVRVARRPLAAAKR